MINDDWPFILLAIGLTNKDKISFKGLKTYKFYKHKTCGVSKMLNGDWSVIFPTLSNAKIIKIATRVVREGKLLHYTVFTLLSFDIN